MTPKAILVASFGTSNQETLQKTIAAVEQEVQSCFPSWQVARAFTSPTIRKIWRRRGVEVDDVSAALERLSNKGVAEVVVLPTHLLAGEEYHRLCAQAEEFASRFARCKVAKPLLFDEHDQMQAAQILASVIKPSAKQALVWMGHGSQTQANGLYERLNELLKAQGHYNVFVGTVEAQPGIEEVLKRVKQNGFTSVLLAPLMLVAGDHAQNDMAGQDKTSWKNRFLQAGFQVDCILRGLGEFAPVRSMYIEHLQKAINE